MNRFLHEEPPRERSGFEFFAVAFIVIVVLAVLFFVVGHIRDEVHTTTVSAPAVETVPPAVPSPYTSGSDYGVKTPGPFHNDEYYRDLESQAKQNLERSMGEAQKQFPALAPYMNQEMHDDLMRSAEQATRDVAREVEKLKQEGYK